MVIKKLLIISILLSSIFAEKIKDISSIVGIRDNQLLGYGLVVGLNGTGDGSSSIFTLQSLANMLQSVNVKVDAAAIKSKNVAAVMVTAKLGSFSRQGDKTDVLISSIGDAKSLEGGTLLMTPLKGVDGKIYAVGQGPISIGGRAAGGGAKGGNHPLVATIPNGATVEKEIVFDMYNKESATISLKESNLQNAVSAQNSINTALGGDVAVAIDSRTIKLKKPENSSMVEFLAKVQDVDVGINKTSKIVIDERTGTIIAGIDITIDPVVISHGDLTIKISPVKEAVKVGEDDDGTVDMKEGVTLITASNILNTQDERPTVANIARALKKMGAEPKNIISILEAMKKAGAINAELEII